MTWLQGFLFLSSFFFFFKGLAHTTIILKLLWKNIFHQRTTSVLITEVWRQFERKDKLAQTLQALESSALPGPHHWLLTTSNKTFHHQRLHILTLLAHGACAKVLNYLGIARGCLGNPCSASVLGSSRGEGSRRGRKLMTHWKPRSLTSVCQGFVCSGRQVSQWAVGLSSELPTFTRWSRASGWQTPWHGESGDVMFNERSRNTKSTGGLILLMSLF